MCITIRAVPILASNSWRYSYLKNEDSPYRWYGVSLFEEKNLLSVDFPNFKQLNHAFKGPIWQKIGQGSNLLSQKLQKIRLIAMSL